LAVEAKALAGRGDLHVELAVSETVAFSSVHRILFCVVVLNSWYLLIGGGCKISLFYIFTLLLFQLEWVLQAHSSFQKFSN
jgi:hypothetical protein